MLEPGSIDPEVYTHYLWATFYQYYYVYKNLSPLISETKKMNSSSKISKNSNVAHLRLRSKMSHWLFIFLKQQLMSVRLFPKDK